MPCFSPLSAWYARSVNPSGKRSLVFDKSRGFADFPAQVGCDQCIGCELEYCRQWAIRCVHEASLYLRNCFVTLTYDRANIPPNGSLVQDHIVLFNKSLREKYGPGIRIMYCGEYGSKRGRPHFHACIFNHDFDDKVFKEKTDAGYDLYTSRSLDTLWGKGRCDIGSVTYHSAGYVARYVLGKLTVSKASNAAARERYARHYGEYVDSNGVVCYARCPEFFEPSRRPGLGRPWFDRYWRDVYPADRVVINGKCVPPPKYYDRLLERFHPDVFKQVKLSRSLKGLDPKFVADNDTFRLRVKEVVQEASMFLLPRGLEYED